jgi:hypothetical protein
VFWTSAFKPWSSLTPRSRSWSCPVTSFRKAKTITSRFQVEAGVAL